MNKKGTMSEKNKGPNEDSNYFLKKAKAKENCSICFEPSETTLSCDHYFHEKCIQPWIKTNNTCPLCKKIIDDRKPIPSKPASNTEEDVHLARRLFMESMGILPFSIGLEELYTNYESEVRGLRRLRDFLTEEMKIAQQERKERGRDNEVNLVACAQCGTSLAMGRDYITNCSDCGDMFYCSCDCEQLHKDVHNCEHSIAEDNHY